MKPEVHYEKEKMFPYYIMYSGTIAYSIHFSIWSARKRRQAIITN